MIAKRRLYDILFWGIFGTVINIFVHFKALSKVQFAQSGRDK